MPSFVLGYNGRLKGGYGLVSVPLYEATVITKQMENQIYVSCSC